MKYTYLLIKYIKSVLWRVATRLSYIEDARCLKVKEVEWQAMEWVKWLIVGTGSRLF